MLLSRTSARQLPFQGLWRFLTNLNVLEYKGPTASARRGHLIRLIELGLGIHRRLNEDRASQRRQLIETAEVSFWYLTHHLGRRFLRKAEGELDEALESVSPGIWRCRVLGYLVFLVSGDHLPVERDSLPLHVLAPESEEKELATARLVGEAPPLWELYSPWIARFHQHAVEELEAMARTKRREMKLHLEPLIRLVGVKEVVRQVGLDRVINEVGAKRVIDEVGMKRVIDEVGMKRVIDEVGIDIWWENLSPAQRRELKRKFE